MGSDDQNAKIKNLEETMKVLQEVISTFIESGLRYNTNLPATIQDQQDEGLTPLDVIRVALGEEYGKNFVDDIEEIETTEEGLVTIKLKDGSKFSKKTAQSISDILTKYLTIYKHQIVELRARRHEVLEAAKNKTSISPNNKKSSGRGI